MKRNFLPLLALPLVSAIMVGCDSGQTSIAANQEITPDSTLLQDEQLSEQTLEPQEELVPVVTKYDGNYQTFCGVSNYALVSDSAVTVTSITGETGKITIFNYEDDRCTLPATPFQTVIDVSFSYPGDTIMTSRGVADFIDIAIESVTLDGQAPSISEQQLLNAAGFVGTRYDVIALQDSALYMGEITSEFRGDAAEARPIQLGLQVSIEQ